MERKDIKILVVDDEIGFCEMISDILSDEGYNLTGFTSPVKALDHFRENSADIVITDIKMPEMSGIEFFKEIKKINNHIPVIIVTGFATIEIAIEALRLGAQNFLTKPFHLEEIIATVNKIVKMKKLLWQKKDGINIIEPEYALTISSDIKQIDATVLHILQIISAIKELPDETEMDIAASLTEAVSNSIIHGNKLDVNKKINIFIDVRDEEIEIKIIDEGEGFNPSLLPDPRDDKNILSEIGRGVLLMNFYMDKIIYSEKGNEVILIKKFK